MIKIKIDVTKIDKSHLYKGEKGTYLDITLIETPGNQYGNDFIAVQEISKEARDNGLKGAILGNAKHLQPKAQQQPLQGTSPVKSDTDLPF